MRSRSRGFTVVLALAVAAAAAGVAYVAVAGSRVESRAPAAVAVPTALPTGPVIVARWDIPAATVLTADMLEVRLLPPEARSPRALTDLEAAVGQLTAVPLSAGEQVLDTRLTEQPVTGETFARQIPPGMRAISLVFDEVQGVGGLVQPGDRVDVIAFFEIEVDDLTFDERNSEDDLSGDSTDGESDAETDAVDLDDVDLDDLDDLEDLLEDMTGEADYTQYVSIYVVQNVEVLAVAQAVTPEEVGIADRDMTLPGPEGDAAVATEPAEPKSRPDARSVTLAVTPEDAQRLLLASQISTDKTQERDAALRLVERAPGDTTIYELPPSQLGQIPLNGLLGNLETPVTPTELVIIDVQFARRVVTSGEYLEFTVTVKNISDRVIPAGSAAPPEYAYTEGIAYDTLGFFSEAGTYSIGLSVAGAGATNYPYRWSLGRDLAQGETTTISGAIQVTEPTPGTRYWFGVIQEPNVVTQDGAGVTDVTVMASEVVQVAAPSAVVLAAPEASAALVGSVTAGDRLTVLGVHGPWFHVRAGAVEGWIFAGAIAAEPGASEAAAASGDAETADESGWQWSRFDPWR